MGLVVVLFHEVVLNQDAAWRDDEDQVLRIGPSLLG